MPCTAAGGRRLTRREPNPGLVLHDRRRRLRAGRVTLFVTEMLVRAQNVTLLRRRWLCSTREMSDIAVRTSEKSEETRMIASSWQI